MRSLPHEQEHPLIIIVEDDAGNARLLETVLQEEAQCQTAAYQSGEDVLGHLEEIAQRHPDLFLIDYTLPGINGLALCTRLQTCEEMQHIPTILVTGSARCATLEEAERQGVPVIGKPYDLDELLELVDQRSRVMRFARIEKCEMNPDPVTFGFSSLTYPVCASYSHEFDKH